jgi:hypothetical protein
VPKLQLGHVVVGEALASKGGGKLALPRQARVQAGAWTRESKRGRDFFDFGGTEADRIKANQGESRWIKVDKAQKNSSDSDDDSIYELNL